MSARTGTLQKRQRDAIERLAKRNGCAIIGEFSDETVSGEEDIASRPGFSALLDALEANGTHVVIVEDASGRAGRPMPMRPIGRGHGPRTAHWDGQAALSR